MYDLIIIGGGPAGLTASIYAIRKRLNALTITKDLGGKTNFSLKIPWIEEYQVIRGQEVVDRFKRELEYLDFAHKLDSVEKVQKKGKGFIVELKSGEKVETKAILVASGVRQAWMDVPGEKEFISKGLCYSAVSYAPLFIDKNTVVIGEGELALKSAAELATVAKSVKVVGTSKDALASPIGKKLAEKDNVEILQDHKVVKVVGGEFAEKLIVKAPDGKESELEMDGAFVEKELTPNTKFIEDLVDLDDQGRVVVNCFNGTSDPGIFAAGDVTNIYAEQVLIAVGEGAKAALSAYEYLLPML
jgi:alkyl hydroperoxide reductase subunit F